MFIERVISINNGWSILTTQKDAEWQDISKVLYDIDATLLISGLKSKDPNASDNNWISFYIHSSFNNRINKLHGWSDFLPDVDIQQAHGSTIRTRFLRNGVTAYTAGSTELTGGDFASNLYVKFLTTTA